MPSKFPTIRVSPFRGINLEDDKYNLQTGDLLQGINIFCNDDGSVQRIDGLTDLFDADISSVGTSSIFEWRRYDGSRDIVFEHDGTLYIVESLLNSPRYTALISGLTASKRIRYITYNDYLFFGNGFDSNKVVVPTHIHSIIDTTESTADATDLASIVTLFNSLKALYNTHISSVTHHVTADTSNTVTSADLDGGSIQADANAAVNEMSGDFEAHCNETGVHYNNDQYREIQAASATDEASCCTLLNEIKDQFNQHVLAGRTYQWGITKPTTAPTLADAAGAALTSGVYQYYYTFYNKYDGFESAPSQIAEITVNPPPNGYVNLTNMDISVDPQVTHKRIYRTFVDGATFYRIAEINDYNTTYQDTTPDDLLGAPIATEDCSSFPVTSIFSLYKDRIYFAGNFSAPYRLYYTEPTYMTLFKEAFSYQDFDVGITGIAHLPNGILIFERHKTWIWLSPPFASPPSVLSSIIGCSNAESITYIDGFLTFVDPTGNRMRLENPVVWQCEHGVFASNGQIPVCISEKINTAYRSCKLNSAVSLFDAKNGRLYCIVASK